MRESPKHAATCAAAVASSSSPIRSASTIRRPHPLQRRVNVRRMGRLYIQQVSFRHGGFPAASYVESETQRPSTQGTRRPPERTRVLRCRNVAVPFRTIGAVALAVAISAGGGGAPIPRAPVKSQGKETGGGPPRTPPPPPGPPG